MTGTTSKRLAPSAPSFNNGTALDTSRMARPRASKHRRQVEIRRILYTTNAIESLNFQLRKALRPKGHFPTDDSVLKVLYLAIQRAKMRWKPASEWPSARNHLATIFGDRLPA